MELQEPRNVSWTYSTSDIIASSTPRQRYIIMPTIFDLSQSSLSMRVGWYNIPWQTFMVHSDLNSPIVGAGISLFGKLAQHLGLHLFNSCSPSCATQHCRILPKKNTSAAASLHRHGRQHRACHCLPNPYTARRGVAARHALVGVRHRCWLDAVGIDANFWAGTRWSNGEQYVTGSTTLLQNSQVFLGTRSYLPGPQNLCRHLLHIPKASENFVGWLKVGLHYAKDKKVHSVFSSFGSATW